MSHALRSAALFAVLVVACSAPREQDQGCGYAEACSADADCVDYDPASFNLFGTEPDARCRAKVCEQGRCRIRNAPPGRPLEDDEDGDCARPACDGTGRVALSFDVGDVPRSSAGPCAIYRCAENASYQRSALLVESSPGILEVDPMPDGTRCGRTGFFVCLGGSCVDERTRGDGGADAGEGEPSDASP